MNKPLPFKGLNIRIPIRIPRKGRGFRAGCFSYCCSLGTGGTQGSEHDQDVVAIQAFWTLNSHV